ncbi:MAG: nitroreductase family protein [Bacteroidales bacterium]|nr:nitroreductase family protein [Bacteroidales bacterium]
MIDKLLTRRSCRKFTEQAVEKDKIESLLKAALLSPSGKNIRPWEFMVVDHKETLVKLSETREHGSAFLAGAPLAIVVLADSTKTDVWVEDCSIAAILIQMEAEEQGLGSCWIQMRNRMHHSNTQSASEFVKETLDVPFNYEVECIIAIGYKQKDRNPYDIDNIVLEKVSYNNFSNSFF